MEFVARIRVVNSVFPGDLWLWRKLRTSKKWSRQVVCRVAGNWIFDTTLYL